MPTSEVCPICDGASAPRLDVQSVTYLCCSACDHLFVSREREAEFGRDFYNSPAYLELEAKWPKENRLILFQQCMDAGRSVIGRPPRTVLDFGAGQQDIAEKKQIFPSITFYDPFGAHCQQPQEGSVFDFVILTEVLEHVFDPLTVLDQVRRYSEVCIATTLLSDFNFTVKYLIPEGGHVSIFSLASIKEAARRANFHHELCFWPGQHVYYYHRFTAA